MATHQKGFEYSENSVDIIKKLHDLELGKVY